MKTTIALLITGLIFLLTPMLAVAHGGDRHDDGPKRYKGWVKDQRQADQYRHDRNDRRDWREKRHFKKMVRKHRQERRQFARNHQPRYARPAVYRNPEVVFGFPRVVFHIDW